MKEEEGNKFNVGRKWWREKKEFEARGGEVEEWKEWREEEKDFGSLEELEEEKKKTEIKTV